MSKYFENALNNLKIIEHDRIQLRFNAYIHGYTTKIHYPEFRQIISQKLDLDNYIHLHGIVLSPNYGYIDYQEEWYESNTYSLFTGQNSTHFSIEDVIVDPYTNNVNFVLLIEGEPEDIAIAAENMELLVELYIVGCPSSVPFWKQSMYSGYLMFKNNNFISSFMHLIIAFEGLLRSLTNNSDDSIHKIYKQYTSNDLPNYLNTYRNLRNKIMHGNENTAKKLTKTDIKNLVQIIESLYLNKPLAKTISSTVVLNK